MARTVKGELTHGVFWNFIEKFLMEGAHFISGVILARLLMPSDFGLFGMLSIVVAVSCVCIY